MTGARDFHQRGGGQRNSDRFALATVDAVVPERAPSGALRRDSGPAVGAGAIAIREWRDDEIAFGERARLGADLLDDADELVPDRTELVRGVAAVVPQV